MERISKGLGSLREGSRCFGRSFFSVPGIFWRKREIRRSCSGEMAGLDCSRRHSRTQVFRDLFPMVIRY